MGHYGDKNSRAHFLLFANMSLFQDGARLSFSPDGGTYREPDQAGQTHQGRSSRAPRVGRFQAALRTRWALDVLFRLCWHIPNPELLEAGLGWFLDHGVSSIVPGELSLLPGSRSFSLAFFPWGALSKGRSKEEKLASSAHSASSGSRQEPFLSKTERIWSSFVWKNTHSPKLF